MTALWMLAAEAAKEESSHTAFYMAGGALAVWALVVSALGITQHDFPSAETRRGHHARSEEHTSELQSP